MQLIRSNIANFMSLSSLFLSDRGIIVVVSDGAIKDTGLCQIFGRA